MVKLSVFLQCVFVFGANSSSWDEARSEATRIVKQLSAEERMSLLLGKGWGLTGPAAGYYVGNIPGISRLGVPSILMQDSSGGFRPTASGIVGTVTVWPSLLAASATWDRQLVQKMSGAIAEEFKTKGANVVLGPGLNVQRVARNGRNFEYLSGEDPYLGAQLGTAYISGVQANDEMSVMKHFVLNNQETNRGSPLEKAYAAVVDERTLWELYYPPFEAGVKANVSGVMCSYNKVGDSEHPVNGGSSWACGNTKGIKEDLKGTMGFKGFVVSDWYAAHYTDEIHSGLDIDMPGDGTHFPIDMNSGIFSDANLQKQKKEDVEEAAIRVITPLARLGLLNKTSRCPNGPPCEEAMLSSARSTAHDQMAVESATASIVLLQNGGVLPIDASVKTIGIFGSAADAKPFDNTKTCHGSVLCPACKIPGISWICNAVSAGSTGLAGDYYSGGGSGHIAGKPDQMVSAAAGIKARAEANGIQVTTDFSDDTAKAKAAAASVDVAIVVGATTSHEQADRKDLHLDNDADDLISAIAQVNPKTVVVTLTPGAILTPWRKDLTEGAIVNLFLGGQGTGTALAKVLFGDANPSGHLPITFPSHRDETIEPSENLTITYSEGLKVGYRNAAHKPAFAFGHGLSYTQFGYGPPSSKSCDGHCSCIEVKITNSGARSGQEVVQLYLEFPAHADIPTSILKGFQKTSLLPPGASEVVRFALTSRDCSTYSVDKHDFVMESPDDLVAHIGSSSDDIRQTIRLGEKSSDRTKAHLEKTQGHSSDVGSFSGHASQLPQDSETLVMM
jgi:beta-glucosidase